MRKYHLSGVEHVHMMRRVPRSYDMTRTHIMHQGVNKHVDVVLRCSPKHWKKKKVPVSLVKSEKKKNVVHIRAHAGKGYVAVRKVTNEKYAADRRKVVTAYETKYGAPSANNRTLIHDMKSQLSVMAKKSADYIDGQLAAGQSAARPAPPVPQTQQTVHRPQAEASLPSFPKLPEEPVSASMLSPETEAILKKGGYKRPKPMSSANPYASDYLKQTSDLEFRSLMDSLERSLDEACGKYASDAPKSADPTTDASYGQYESDRRYAASEPEQPEDIYSFEPALKFSDGGEHYIPDDELFDRDFMGADDRFAASDAPQGEDSFDFSRFFAEDEAEYIPPQTDFSGGDDDFVLPDSFRESGEEVTLPQGYDEEEPEPISYNPYPDDDEPPYVPPTIYPEEEEEFAPPTVYPEEEEEFAPPTVYPEEEEEFAPPTVFPDDEEDFVPPTIFLEEEEYVPLPQYPEDDGGYSPAPVSPDRNEYWGDGDYSTNAETSDARQTETFFSRTGGHIKKAIGVIRGSGSGTSTKKDGAYHTNHDVEITYSDRNG